MSWVAWLCVSGGAWCFPGLPESLSQYQQSRLQLESGTSSLTLGHTRFVWREGEKRLHGLFSTTVTWLSHTALSLTSPHFSPTLTLLQLDSSNTAAPHPPPKGFLHQREASKDTTHLRAQWRCKDLQCLKIDTAAKYGHLRWSWCNLLWWLLL